MFQWQNATHGPQLSSVRCASGLAPPSLLEPEALGLEDEQPVDLDDVKALTRQCFGLREPLGNAFCPGDCESESVISECGA